MSNTAAPARPRSRAARAAAQLAAAPPAADVVDANGGKSVTGEPAHVAASVSSRRRVVQAPAAPAPGTPAAAPATPKLTATAIKQAVAARTIALLAGHLDDLSDDEIGPADVAAFLRTQLSYWPGIAWDDRLGAPLQLAGNARSKHFAAPKS